LISPTRSNFQWEELITYDDEIFKSVEYLLENGDIQDEILQALTFTVQTAKGDEIELCPGGKDLKINLKNRVQYGNLLARYYLSTQVRDELKAFISGFHDVIP
jgi:E3 ubiquitin-protein ligase HUWE1